MKKEVFQHPIPTQSGVFYPLVWLSRVDLPDFGCEGRPDAGEICGVVWGERADGCHFWRVAEGDLLAGGLADEMWLGRINGHPALLPRGGQQAVDVAEAYVRVLLYADGLEPQA